MLAEAHFLVSLLTTKYKPKALAAFTTELTMAAEVKPVFLLDFPDDIPPALKAAFNRYYEVFI